MSSSESEAFESYADSDSEAFGSGSETDWLDPPEIRSDMDRMRCNDQSLTEVLISDWVGDETIERLDALKNSTSVKELTIIFDTERTPDQLSQAAFLKLSEVMKCNKSVESFTVYLRRGLLRERFLSTIATSGGWSSIQEMALIIGNGDDIEPLSLTGEHLSSFIIQSENLRTLTLEITGEEAVPIVETLSRTKVQSLRLDFLSPCTLQNGRRRLGTALERCSCITDLRLDFPGRNYQAEFFQILFVESIPKMLGLKKLEISVQFPVDQGFFDMMGQCIGGHQGEIEELRLTFHCTPANSSSIVGLASALSRLKVIRFDGLAALRSQQISELSSVAAECDALEEFGYNPRAMESTAFKAICQLLSKFSSLKRVSNFHKTYEVDLHEESRFVAFLEMIKTSKTIEHVNDCQCRSAEEAAAIEYHCQNNMIHNQIRENGLLAATVPSSAWPLILKEFSDMPDVLYYLLQQKHGAMLGPTHQGCKRKHNGL